MAHHFVVDLGAGLPMLLSHSMSTSTPPVSFYCLTLPWSLCVGVGFGFFTATSVEIEAPNRLTIR